MMRQGRLTILLILLFVTLCTTTSAQQRKPFQGDWEWVVYPKSRKELPPAYRNEPLRSVPVASVYLKLIQRGNKLSGDYSASAHYLARLEDGELEATVTGSTAILELTSGFGGNVTVQISRSGALLHWKIVKSDEGTAYFPEDVYLRRIRPRKRVRNADDQ